MVSYIFRKKFYKWKNTMSLTFVYVTSVPQPLYDNFTDLPSADILKNIRQV